VGESEVREVREWSGRVRERVRDRRREERERGRWRWRWSGAGGCVIGVCSGHVVCGV
jgi:hypothetical protein